MLHPQNTTAVCRAPRRCITTAVGIHHHDRGSALTRKRSHSNSKRMRARTWHRPAPPGAQSSTGCACGLRWRWRADGGRWGCRQDNNISPLSGVSTLCAGSRGVRKSNRLCFCVLVLSMRWALGSLCERSPLSTRPPPHPETMTASDTTPNTAAVGLVFDIDPADPRVISVLVGVACVLVVAAVCFRNGKTQRRSGGGAEEQQRQHQQGQVNMCCRASVLCLLSRSAPGKQTVVVKGCNFVR